MREDNLVMQRLMRCDGNAFSILNLLDSLSIYDYNFTLEEIGNVLNITRERVRQIEQCAIKKLKNPKIGRALKKYTEM